MKNSFYYFGIEFRFRFGFGSVKNPDFGFGPVSVKFHSGRSLIFNTTDLFLLNKIGVLVIIFSRKYLVNTVILIDDKMFR